MLELQGIIKHYQAAGRTVRAVDQVDLRVEAGEFAALRGASGSGKSTLLLIAGGLLAPDSGEVRIANQDPYQLSPEARARFRGREIGFVFQQFHLVPYLSVIDNIRAPALAGAREGVAERSLDLAEQFGLADRLQHVSAQLSTGERQRVALARALLNRPKILLADEPTGNLDPDNAGLVLAALASFATAGGAVLLVTHDAAAAAKAHRTLTIDHGRLVSAPQVHEVTR